MEVSRTSMKVARVTVSATAQGLCFGFQPASGSGGIGNGLRIQARGGMQEIGAGESPRPRQSPHSEPMSGTDAMNRNRPPIGLAESAEQVGDQQNEENGSEADAAP